MAIKVNGETIPENAVMAELKRLMDFYSRHLSRAELGRSMGTLLQKAKEHAVGTRLLLDEVKRRHVDVADAEVEAALQDMIKKSGGDKPLDALLAKQKISRDQLRASIRVGKQLDRLVARITSTVEDCSEDAVEQYYEEHSERYVSPDQAQVRHILVKPASDSEADKAVARSLLEGLKHRILEGESFPDLAAAHSECPSGKETGGSLGWIKQGSTVPEFDRAVFELETGELSDVIETPIGLHLVEKLEQEEGAPLPLEEVRDGIRELLMHERRGRALSEYVEKLRKNALIEDDESGGPAGLEGVLDSFLDGQKGGC